MFRIGSSSEDMRDMQRDDVFLLRLNLLIIMSSAYFKGYPLGWYRKQSIMNNSRHIATETADWGGRIVNFRYNCDSSSNNKRLDNIFYQRVKLLTVMTKTFASGYPMGYHRSKSLKYNLDKICETLFFTKEVNDIEFLKKVA